MKRIQLPLALLAVMLAALVSARFSLALGFLFLTIVSCFLNAPQSQARCCAVTLSVPEILKDLLEAFKVQTPALFGPAGFTQDFSSKTAALGDKITAHISHVPVAGSYDATPGKGFYTAAQDVTTLIEDVPVTINQLQHCPVKFSFLTRLATKGVDLYKAGVANIAFALGRYVVQQVLTDALTGAVTNSYLLPPALLNLDTLEGLRSQCNSQKMASNRFCFLNTTLATALEADDRVKSKLFYGDLQGKDGYRRWQNIGGFAWAQEYADLPVVDGIGGLAADRRLAVVSVRKIEDMTDTVKALGIRKVMDFYPLRDDESNLELCGIAWQEAGTGDVYITVAILFGVGVGNQRGGAGTVTDDAGCLIKTN
jgi:hypothetical protein